MGAPGSELLTRAFRDVGVGGKLLGGFLLGSTLQISMVLFLGGHRVAPLNMDGILGQRCSFLYLSSGSHRVAPSNALVVGVSLPFLYRCAEIYPLKLDEREVHTVLVCFILRCT